MEYTELADYPLPGGTITTWTPVVDETAWIDSLKGPSPCNGGSGYSMIR